jgi:hypothetical protein
LILPRQDVHNRPPAGSGRPATGPGHAAARAYPDAAAYAGAGRMLRDWQDAGILVPDPLPALYVYEQSLPTGRVLQRGVIGALRLVPLDAGPVLPHEDVNAEPVAGRRLLMEATQANLEPILRPRRRSVGWPSGRTRCLPFTPMTGWCTGCGR